MLEIVRGTKNGLYIRNMLHEVGLLKENQAHTLFTDSKISMDNISRLTLSNKSRHFVSKLAFIKEIVKRNLQVVVKIPGDRNLADIGTKPLTKDKHSWYSDILFDEEKTDDYMKGTVNTTKHLIITQGNQEETRELLERYKDEDNELDSDLWVQLHVPTHNKA